MIDSIISVIILAIVAICFYISSATSKYSYPLLSLIRDVFKNQEFSNISTVFSNGTTEFIRADSKGQNYIFAVPKSNSPLSLTTLRILYDLGEKHHIHAKVVITNSEPQPETVIHKQIKDYSMNVWDRKKLTSLAYEQEGALTNEDIKYSVLDTIDTSDDTCHIDTNSNDPIQEKKGLLESILSSFFNGPTRL